MRTNATFAVLALALVASPLSAQVRKPDQVKGRTSSGTVIRTSDGTVIRRTTNIPPGQRPAKGLCRVWIDGVPPGQQPPVTDCATAERNRVANSVVIYGDRDSFPGTGKGKFNRLRDDDDDKAEKLDKSQKREAKALKKANKDAAKAAKKQGKGNRDGEDHNRDN